MFETMGCTSQASSLVVTSSRPGRNTKPFRSSTGQAVLEQKGLVFGLGLVMFETMQWTCQAACRTREACVFFYLQLK